MIALFVAVLLTVSFGAKVSAVSAAPSEEQRLENAVARIKYDIPDADVTVADGIIHIVLDDPEKIPGYSTPEPGLETNVTSASSYYGGTYRDFKYRLGAGSYFLPSIQTFMTKDVTDAVKLKLHHQDICDWIKQKFHEGFTKDMIAAMASSEFRKAITVMRVSYILDFVYYLQTNASYISIVSAQNQSSEGKVSVVLGSTPDGFLSYLYLPWEGRICNSYGGYDASWFTEIYDLR